MTVKETQKPLIPELKPSGNFEETLKSLSVGDTEETALANLKLNFNNNVNTITDDSNNSDSFFKAVIDKLENDENISTKTEYMDTQEVFAMTKLDLLKDISNFPLLDVFNDKFKLNRISLKRRGRQEIIMALVERQQEVERENRVLLRQGQIM